MRWKTTLTEKQKARLGDVAVALLLAVAFFATACGGGEAGSDQQTASSGAVVDEPGYVATPASTAPAGPATPAVTGPVSYEEAEAAFRERRFDEAVRLFTAYTEDRAKNPWGHYMLGLSAWKAGDHASAARAFEAALDLDPGHVKSLFNLGRVFLEAERTEEALAVIEEGLIIDSLSADGFRLLGRARVELGMTGEAIDAYRKALTLDERDAWSMNNLGYLYIGEGRFDEALRPLARAVELDGDNAVFHNNLGMALERTGRFTAAREAYRVAAEGSHDKAAANLARIGGRADAEWATPVDLTVLAQEFVEQVARWRDEGIVIVWGIDHGDC